MGFGSVLLVFLLIVEGVGCIGRDMSILLNGVNNIGLCQLSRQVGCGVDHARLGTVGVLDPKVGEAGNLN